MMRPITLQSHFFKRLIWQAAKLPFVYLMVGTILILFSFTDDAFTPFSKWKQFFDLTNTLGNIFLAFAVISFIYNIMVKLCSHYEAVLIENHQLVSLIITSIRKSLRIIFILIAINIIISLAHPTHFNMIVINNIINVILIASVGWIAIKVLSTLEAAIYHRMLKLTQEEHIRINALYTKIRVVRNIATVVIIIVTLSAILMSFSSVTNIGISVLASAGFITAIIGLSAQKTLFSLFSGLQIIISQPIKIGDLVMIEKEIGLIEEITFTYVILKLADKRRLLVPINYFIEKTFINWSREENSLQNSFHLYVDYLMPISPLRDELERILKGSQHWDGTSKTLSVSSLNDHCIEVRIQVSARNPDDLFNLQAEVKEKLLAYIKENYPEHLPQARSRNIESDNHTTLKHA